MAYILAAEKGVISLPATAAVASNLYHGVSISTTELECIVAPDQGLSAIGVQLNKPAAGEACKIFVGPGIVPVMVGTNGITLNRPVSCDSSGHFEDASDNDVVFGQALETATSGEIAQIFMGCVQGGNATVANWYTA